MGVDTKTYIALSVVMFLEYAVWGAWAPVLATRLLGPLKLTGKQTGWVYATLPIACIVSPLAAGWLADQYVSIRSILIVAHFLGAILIFFASQQNSFKPMMVVMLLYSLCYAATMPLVNAALFNATANISDAGVKLATEGKVFIWAPVAWALIGWLLTGWRMTRATQGDGSDCLKLAAILSVLMAAGCFLLPDNDPPRAGGFPIVTTFQMLGNMNFLLFIGVSLVVAGLMQFYFLGTAQFLQDSGLSSKHVPASMALAQVAQAAATFFLLALFLKWFGAKWTLVIGAACWFVLYLVYIVGKPRALMIFAQPLHGLAYVFFIIVGQIFAESVAPAEIRSSMQALIMAVTTGVGMFFGTQFAGIVMDRFNVEGKFHWSKIWAVPCVITLAGTLVLAGLFQQPKSDSDNTPAADSNAPVSARDVEQK